MKKALILSLILGSSIVLLPSFEVNAATGMSKPQIVIQTRRTRRDYRSYDRRNDRWRDRRDERSDWRRNNRWNEHRNERSYWRRNNRYYNRGRVVSRTRVTRNGYTTVYRTRVRRNY